MENATLSMRKFSALSRLCVPKSILMVSDQYRKLFFTHGQTQPQISGKSASSNERAETGDRTRFRMEQIQNNIRCSKTASNTAERDRSTQESAISKSPSCGVAGTVVQALSDTAFTGASRQCRPSYALEGE